MILHKYQIILVSLFLFPILAILFGDINIGGANLQFFFSASSLVIALLYLCKWGCFNRNLYIVPLIFSLLITIPLYNGRFGLIQIFYVISPLLYFFVGAYSNINLDFMEKFKEYLKFLIGFICLLGLLSLLIDYSQINSRPVSIYLSLIGMIALILFNDFKYRVLSIFLILFILLSGARGALFAGLLPLAFSYINKSLSFKISALMYFLIISILLVFNEKFLSLIFSIDTLRERTFYDGIYSYEKILNFDFNSSGREVAWPIYWDHIFKRSTDIFHTLIGEGPGATSKFGIEILGDRWAHPHNELIRILIDYGLLGLISFILFWVGLSYQIFKNNNKNILRMYTSIMIFLIIISMTDNPLMYPLYFGNLVLFLAGLSLSISRNSKI
ncbi:O-antigen ligase domain-containing protein [Acinetobacter cumulans]|uniref:O-antigen ligase domain-containing protein n=1 Tax=Acinetobacter cumulans TaxID=2136182 RepID=A0A498DCW8_9GAMM|nr:O-antigen ligase family protein [Acinetobacter cumulans]RLL35846.1 O-antigen ligase domain-containing protein [Acinetobacter cumulans]